MKFFHKLSFATIALVGLTSASVALAWQPAPASGPTNGNVPAPINTGSSDQVKAGGGIGAEFFAGKSGLFANTFACSNNLCPNGPNILEALAVSDLGNIAGTILKGLTVTRSGGLRIIDGNQAAGKILTSDASGNASWQPAPSGGTGTATLPPGNLHETLRHNGTTWEASNTLMNDTSTVGINSPAGSALVLSGTQNARHIFMQWRPEGGLGSRAWAGFGSFGSKIFTIANEYGQTGNGSVGHPGSIALDPGINAAVGVNSPNREPDSSFGTALDVNGKVRIRGGDPNEGDVLTVVDPAGNGGTDGYAEWQPINPTAGMLVVRADGPRTGANAYCPSGYQLISGGGHCYGDLQGTSRREVTSSEPGPGKSGAGSWPASDFQYWHVDCHPNTEGGATAYAMCMPLPGSSAPVFTASIASTIFPPSCLSTVDTIYQFSASLANGTGPYTYAWSASPTPAGSNTSSSTSTFSPNLLIGTTYTITLTVTDSQGATVTTTRTVTSVDC